MAQMGRFCKAYPLSRFREFSGWTENQQNLRKDRAGDGRESGTVILSDDDFLYVQENLIVTDGIYIDENIVFDQVTQEWTEFASVNLGFQLPEHLAGT